MSECGLIHCSRCGESKAEGDFYPSALRSRKPLGRQRGSAWCRECFKVYNRARMQADYLKYRKPRARRRYAEFAERKMAVGCMYCGEGHPAALDFHHRDPSQKGHTISRSGNAARALVEAEIAKCDVLCSNCHRKTHKGAALSIRTPVDDYIVAAMAAQRN